MNTSWYQMNLLKKSTKTFRSSAYKLSSSLARTLESDTSRGIPVRNLMSLDQRFLAASSERLLDLCLHDFLLETPYYDDYIELYDAVRHHSAHLHMTEERFVDFVAVATDECRYALVIFDLIAASIFKIHGVTYPAIAHPMCQLTYLEQLIKPFSDYRSLDGKTDHYWLLRELVGLWEPAVKHVVALCELVDLRDKIRSELPPDLCLPPERLKRSDPRHATNWFDRLRSAHEEQESEILQTLKSLHDEVAKTRGKAVFKRVDDLLGGLKLDSNTKLKNNVRHHLRNMREEGLIKSVPFGKEYLLDGPDFHIALVELRERMKSSIDKERRKKFLTN